MFFLVMRVKNSIKELNPRPHYGHVCNPLNNIRAHLDIIGFANQFAGAPFPPSTQTCHFNRLVLNFLDVEAKQGGNSDIDDSPRRCLSLVGLENRAPMLCFDLNFCMNSFVF